MTAQPGGGSMPAVLGLTVLGAGCTIVLGALRELAQ